jgi:hypothetical protein
VSCRGGGCCESKQGNGLTARQQPSDGPVIVQH